MGKHTVFLLQVGILSLILSFLATSLVYSMGSNSSGQLGINDPYTQQKYSPVLIEVLLEKGPVDVKCGDVHSMVLCRSGDVFSWGSNDYG